MGDICVKSFDCTSGSRDVVYFFSILSSVGHFDRYSRHHCEN